MSKYTTGELAKKCGVTVWTVQHYDSRNPLVPSSLSEGAPHRPSQRPDPIESAHCISASRNHPLGLSAFGCHQMDVSALHRCRTEYPVGKKEAVPMRYSLKLFGNQMTPMIHIMNAHSAIKMRMVGSTRTR